MRWTYAPDDFKNLSEAAQKLLYMMKDNSEFPTRLTLGFLANDDCPESIMSLQEDGWIEEAQYTSSGWKLTRRTKKVFKLPEMRDHFVLLEL